MRRGCTRSVSRRYGAPRAPGGTDSITKLILSFGDDFSATFTSIRMPSGSENQKPFPSKPFGGSIRRTPCPSIRCRNGSTSSS